MFGKPEWFREKSFGWGLMPITWQGWVYVLVWTSVMLVPFLIFLLALNLVPEAVVWLLVAISALTLDVRSIVREIRSEAAGDVFVIDEETDNSQLATQNYEMHLRD